MYRYSESDTDFIMIDGRNVEIPRFRRRDDVHTLCLLHGAVGLAILTDPADSASADYCLEFFGLDGVKAQPTKSVQMCSVAFADLLGIKPFHTQRYAFMDDAGIHNASIMSHLGECKAVKVDKSSRAGSTLCLGELEI